MLTRTGRTLHKSRVAFLIVVFMLGVASCGGGGGGGSPEPAPSNLAYASPQVLTVGAQAAAISPTVSGTVTAYSISPALPAGLSISSTTGNITGTPTAESAASTYVVTAQNSSGSTTFSLSIAVLPPAPSSLTYISPDKFIIGVPIQPLNPTLAGLATRYAVAPALPAGLTMDTVTGQIGGTPTSLAASANYVITASNGTGSTDFTLMLSVVLPPPSALSYSTPQSWVAGTVITPISPSVTGLVTQYSVAPALPAGLALNAVTGLIAGTPTAATADGNYTVTASNASGSTTFVLSITVLIPPPSALSYAGPQTFTQNTAITPLNPTVTGIATAFSVYPSLPAGLSINPSTGQIAGTPSVAAAAANYLITAANTTGSITFSLGITVRIAAPSSLSYISPRTYTVGTPIVAAAPTVTGTVASYAIAPALPAGLAFNTASGVITGTPTAPHAAENYTITATNSTGSTTFPLSITVVLLAPQSLSYPNPQTLAAGSSITPINPFIAGYLVTYSVSPTLPAGLSLNPATGQIAGTPTSASAASTYTVTATNASGSTTFALSIAIATVGVSPAQISRLVAAGTPVVIQLGMQSQSLSGPLYITASDSYGLFNPAAAVTTSANGYAVALTVSPAIAAGHYTGNALLTLCHDSACTSPQAPASIDVAFNVQVLSSTSTWPGNNTSTLAAYAGVADWTMFQGNAAHTGYVPVGVDPNAFTTRWQGGPALNNGPNDFNGAFAYTLTTDGGQLFVATGTTLYALKELDGTQVWTYSASALPFPSINPPAEANGTVYMAAGQQSSTYMFAFDETSGSVVFQSPMSSQWEHYLAPTIGPEGVYTNAGTYGGLFGFDFSGNELFFDSLAQTSQWTPAVDANHVYSYTGVLTVSDPLTGAVQAAINDPTFDNFEYIMDGSAVLGAPGSVFAANYANAYINGGSEHNTLLDFNTNTQAITWQVTGDYGYNPAYNAGVLYAVNNSPFQVEARSETDGSLLWSWAPPQSGDNTFESDVLLTSSMLFVSTNLATYGIDTTTHQLVFSYPFPGRLALSHNGILYIQGVGPIVAINVK